MLPGPQAPAACCRLLPLSHIIKQAAGGDTASGRAAAAERYTLCELELQGAPLQRDLPLRCGVCVPWAPCVLLNAEMRLARSF